MKKFLFSLLILLSGCTYESNSSIGSTSGDRFVVIYEQNEFPETFQIILDKETGEKYLLYHTSYASGLTYLY